ncbi:MAG: hypothetical protein QG635_1233, partial [Bacteroidota bacterium]|nr:hypothetical protein [Bacteroidota bacterium]
TNDKNKLLKAIDKITVSGGTDYNAAFFYPPAGAELIAEKGKYKRTIIFLTDGVTQGNEDSIVYRAKLIDASIFCITFGIKAPDILRRIAARTGGLLFDGISTEDETIAAFRNILAISQGISPCNVEWTSSGCDFDRILNLSLFQQPGKFSDEFGFSINSFKTSGLKLSPSSYYYGKVIPGNPKSQFFTMTARNDSIRIDNIISTNPLFTVKFGALKKPFIIQRDSSVSIEVEFNPTDTNYAYSVLNIQTNACFDNKIYLSGGLYGFTGDDNKLKLIQPIGDERLIAGSLYDIIWEGILPADTIWMEFSTDNGDTWKTISKMGSGLSYSWKVPPQASDLCLMRISQVNRSSFSKLKLLSGHFGGVYALAWDNTGKKIASGSDEGDIYIWNVDTETFTILASSLPWVNTIAWSSDGKWIVSGDDTDIIFWNAETHEEDFRLSGHTSTVYSLVFSPDNKYLASGDQTGNLIIWDLVAKSIYQKMKIHSKVIYDLDWNSTGDRIITGSWDSTAILIDPFAPAVLDTIRLQSYIYSAAFSPDGKKIAFSGLMKNVEVWNINPLQTFKSLDKKTDRLCPAIAWSPDGKYLAAGTGNYQVLLWNVSDFTEYYSFRGHFDGVLSLAWNNKGKKLRIASGSYDTNIEIWSPEDIPIDEPLVQKDQSPSTWRIVAPEVRVSPVIFDKTLTGRSLDTIIIGMIDNSNNYPIRIDSVAITGNDALNFKILTENKPFTMAVRTKKDLEIRFAPQTAGVKTSNIRFYHQAGFVDTSISGEGIVPEIKIISHIIDFGKVISGKSRNYDTAALRNIGAADIIIDSIRQIGPDTVQFRIINDIKNFNLGSNMDLKLQLGFSPSDAGRTSGAIAVYHTGIGSPDTVQLYGEGVEYGILSLRSIEYPPVICIPAPLDSILNIKNIGSDIIDFTSATITGVNASEFGFTNGNFLPFSLAVDDSEDISIRFNPLSSGIKTARLKLFSNIGGNNV